MLVPVTCRTILYRTFLLSFLELLGVSKDVYIYFFSKVRAGQNHQDSSKMIAQEDIFGPFLALQLLSIVVWFFMYSKRIPFIDNYIAKQKKDGVPLKSEDLGDPSSKHYLPMIAPQSVMTSSDNLRNLFEVPVMFYAMTGYLYMTRVVDETYLWTAWTFVLLRFLHSVIHCTFNAVMPRFLIYVASSMALWFMIVRATINHGLVGYPNLE